MIVVDSSAMLELLTNGPAAAAVRGHVEGDLRSMHAPHLIELEIAQVARRLVRRGVVDAAVAGGFFAEFRGLGVSLYPHGPLLDRIWALRDNVSAYDGAYVALALELDARLITCDRRLSRAPIAELRAEYAG